MSVNKKDFFISYTSADKKWAEWIAWQLEEAGYSVAIQLWDFRPGGNFVLEMNRAATECERTIAVLSPAFLMSGFTQPEWAAAFAQDPNGIKRTLIPVRVEECELKGLFRQIIYIDLFNLNENECIQALLEGLKDRVKPVTAPVFPERKIVSLPSFPAQINQETFARLDDLPHPVAAAYAKIKEAVSQQDQFEAIDHLLKNTINYLMAVALSQYWQDAPERRKLQAWLHLFTASHLLTSLDLFDRVGNEYLALSNKPQIYTVLYERYFTPVDEGSPMQVAYHALGGLAHQPAQDASPETVTPRAFLRRWLSFRQSHWEGNPHEVDSGLRSQLSPALLPAMLQLLFVYAPFFRYNLRYVERVDHDGQEWVYTMIGFIGAQGKPVLLPTPIREKDRALPSYKPNRLYLCSAQNQPLICLHPFLITHLYEMYFLEYVGEEKTIWYNHCSSPKRYTPPDYYHYLSSWFDAANHETELEGDFISDLRQASDELDQAESEIRINEMPLSVLLSHLSEHARTALEIGLGESLRLGQFWLGVEFLLMGLSKIEDGALSRKLTGIGVSGRSFRGSLRALVPVRDWNWKKNRDVHSLGSVALSDLLEFPAHELPELYTNGNSQSVVITPRLLSILRAAVSVADGGRVTDRLLLLSCIVHHQAIPVQLLFTLMTEAGHDPLQWQNELAHGID